MLCILGFCSDELQDQSICIIQNSSLAYLHIMYEYAPHK
jgi:hypothetical protein